MYDTSSCAHLVGLGHLERELLLLVLHHTVVPSAADNALDVVEGVLRVHGSLVVVRCRVVSGGGWQHSGRGAMYDVIVDDMRASGACAGGSAAGGGEAEEARHGGRAGSKCVPMGARN